MADKNAISLFLSNGQLNKTTELWKSQNLTLHHKVLPAFTVLPSYKKDFRKEKKPKQIQKKELLDQQN